MYYGLFIKVGRKFIRVDTTTGYTLDTAKVKFAAFMRALNGRAELRKLPPVKLIDAFRSDKKYARSII